MFWNPSWPEWLVCLIASVAAVLSVHGGRAWNVLGLLALVAGWLFGTATWLLFPAVTGNLALLLLGKSALSWRRAGLGLALAGSVLSIFLCWLFPLPEIPALPGPHKVGALSFELPADGSLPALLIQAWYPAKDDKKLSPSAWLPDVELVPDVPFHRIAKASANSRTGTELPDSPERLPVVFYEHSWTGHRAENVAQVESLASRGFVVIAVDHPGQAARVKFADGSVVVGKLPASLDFSTANSVRKFEELAEQCLLERAGNIRRVRRALIRGSVPRLANRLDLEQTGVFGFSFGGTSAWRLCATDPSFTAGANEDGFLLSGPGPSGPFLFFDQELPDWLLKPAGPDEAPENVLIRRSESRILGAMKGAARFRVILEGSRHEAFTDRIFTCRIPRLARVGIRPAGETHRIVTSHLALFFERELTEKHPDKPTGAGPAHE